MNNTQINEKGVTRLRELHMRLRPGHPIFKQIIEPKNTVLDRYQKVFSDESLPNLTEQEFREFLLFEKNCHWNGLFRHGPKMCSDMTRLRDALALLFDESRHIEVRFDKAVDMIPGMGKAVVTALLLVRYPETYGVWNNTSEGGLKTLELWPRIERGDSLGRMYIKINRVFGQLSQVLEIDLWTLDALWWQMLQEESDKSQLRAEEPRKEYAAGPEPLPAQAQRFGLERHLQEFLRDNWNQTTLGQEWSLHSEPGDDEAGYEYACGVGRIDLLARHRTEPRWLVVELKRDQSSDDTVGQVLRYMGWIERHLAESGEEVRGLIIAREADDALAYALSALQNVDLMLYEVEFRLCQPPEPGGQES